MLRCVRDDSDTLRKLAGACRLKMDIDRIDLTGRKRMVRESDRHTRTTGNRLNDGKRSRSHVMVRELIEIGRIRIEGRLPNVQPENRYGNLRSRGTILCLRKQRNTSPNKKGYEETNPSHTATKIQTLSIKNKRRTRSSAPNASCLSKNYCFWKESTVLKTLTVITFSRTPQP